MRWIRVGSILAFAWAMNAMSMPAFAGDAAEDRLARAYYDEAVKELEKSGPAKARLMFERVITLGPNSVGARLMLGECHKREGKLASAWRAYREAIDVATRIEQPMRAEQAARLAASLEPRLAKLKLQLPEEAWQFAGLQIRIDDKPVDAKNVHLDFPVDIGEHVVNVVAEGKHHVEAKFVVQNDGSNVEVALESPPPLQAPTPVVAKEVPAPVVVRVAKPVGMQALHKPIVPVKPVSPAVYPSKLEIRRTTAGYALILSGMTTLFAGGVMGIAALDNRNLSNDGFCRGNWCTPAGIALRDQSIVAGHASTGLLIAGTVLGGVGGVLVHWPGKTNERVSLSVVPTGIVFHGNL